MIMLLVCNQCPLPFFPLSKPTWYPTIKKKSELYNKGSANPQILVDWIVSKFEGSGAVTAQKDSEMLTAQAE